MHDILSKYSENETEAVLFQSAETNKITVGGAGNGEKLKEFKIKKKKTPVV